MELDLIHFNVIQCTGRVDSMFHPINVCVYIHIHTINALNSMDNTNLPTEYWQQIFDSYHFIIFDSTKCEFNIITKSCEPTLCACKSSMQLSMNITAILQITHWLAERSMQCFFSCHSNDYISANKFWSPPWPMLWSRHAAANWSYQLNLIMIPFW